MLRTVALAGFGVMLSYSGVAAETCLFKFGSDYFACQCRNLGFRLGTQEMLQCISTLSAEHQARSSALLGGLLLLNQQRPQPTAPLNCTTFRQGVFVQTQCR